MLKIFDNHVVITFDTYRHRSRLKCRLPQYRCDIDQRHARRGNHHLRQYHTRLTRCFHLIKKTSLINYPPEERMRFAKAFVGKP